MRLMNTVLLTCLIVLASSVYLLKTQSKLLKRDIVRLKNKIERAQASSDILRAEIAHLENPERLSRLAKQYLNLEAYDGSRALDREIFNALLNMKRDREAPL